MGRDTRQQASEQTTRLVERLRRIRTARGITQQHLADQIGMHRSALTEAETGKRKLTLEEALALCLALDVDPGRLVDPSPMEIAIDTAVV